MSRFLKHTLAMILAVFWLVSCLGMAVEAKKFEEKSAGEIQYCYMHRLYNPNSGEHFYTGSEEERDDLVAVGWKYEGQAWAAPTNCGEPVYRMFNPNSGDHHYTMSEKERDDLKDAGWKYEGVAWNSLSKGVSEHGIVHYRLYNPNADAGSHHYTASVKELNDLVDLGWKYEGISFYGYAVMANDPNHEHELIQEAVWDDPAIPGDCMFVYYYCECGIRINEHESCWVTVKLPTQTTAGVKETVCGRCGRKDTAEIPAGIYAGLDGDPIYYVNKNENSCIYRISPDNSDNRLILDRKASGMKAENGWVVFDSDSYELFAYNISTKEIIQLDDYLSLGHSIQLFGDYLFYEEDSGNGGSNYRINVQYNLKTGEKSVLSPIQKDAYLNVYSGYGMVYLEEITDNANEIYAYDLETENRVLIYKTERNWVVDVFVTDSGVIINKWELEWDYNNPNGTYINDVRFFPADGSEIKRLDYSQNYNIDHADENGAFSSVLLWEDDHYYRTLLYTAFDESMKKDTVVLLRNTGEYYNLYDVNDGRVLIETKIFDYDDDSDVYNYYLFDKEYFEQTGSLIALDTRGVIGTMFKNGDFPLIDSSTARKPLTADLYKLFVTDPGNEGKAPICSTTHGAWLNIADKKADLAFLAAPTAEEQAYLKEKGVEIEMKLYAGDGLVFIGNVNNPVTNLTHEQIIGIYTGKITNWSEVGGPDKEIKVFYRDPQSGSQRLFESIVFKGLEKPNYDALGFKIAEGMWSIVDQVGKHDYSIGFTIMTYIQEVYENQNVKILSVNGVAPKLQTITDGSYVYGTKGYIVIRSDEPEDSPARRLFDWFGNEISDEILINHDINPVREIE